MFDFFHRIYIIRTKDARWILHNQGGNFIKNKLSPQDAAELMLISARIRRSALEMVYNATSGHLGGSFSICELLAVLYFHEMHIDPHHPLTQTGTGLCSVKAIVPLLFTLRWHSAVISFWRS